ncbi:MAG: GNAT family N-acetyltransferase [Anaerolineae bacterium]|nr:GNAT family N-acetyltransferase [Anaerolineae bacterium]
MTIVENGVKLKEGFSWRPGSIDDVPQAVALFNACEQVMTGKQDFAISVTELEWKSPGFDPQSDIRLVYSPEDKLVGYMEVWMTADPPVHPWVWGRVHPEYEGLGIATFLMAWAEEHAGKAIQRVPQEARVAMRSISISTHQPSIDLLAGFGMHRIRHSYQMRITMQAAPAAPQWPEGIQVRTYKPEDLEAVYRADDEAFQDHFGYVAEPFESGLARFKHFHVGDKDGFDPDLWFLAMDGDEIAGVSLCRKTAWDDKDIGWVSSLAVRRPWRKRGLGLALLQHSFLAFWARGQTTVGLGVDASNLTGALRLYERAGMHVHFERNMYEKELRPGKDLSKVTLDDG